MGLFVISFQSSVPRWFLALASAALLFSDEDGDFGQCLVVDAIEAH